jgi:hypothetical protein
MNTATDIPPLARIEARAGAYRIAHDALTEVVTLIHDEQEQVKRRYLRCLKTLVGQSAEALNALLAEIEANPDVFTKPRSRVMSGIKLGYRKGTGKVLFDDAAKVVERIRKLLPDQVDLLVKVTEEPIKSGLATVDANVLKRLGVTVEATGDVVFVKVADSEIDKLVSALLDGLTDAEIE